MFKREPLHDEPLSDSLRELRERGDGFRMPDNYLQDLRERLPAAVAERPSARIRPLTRRRSWLAIAASVALLLSLGWAWLASPDRSPATVEQTLAAADLDALSDEDILAYVEENIGDFELSLLYENELPANPAQDLTETFSDEDLDILYYELMEE
jgi:hypothetical protein